MLRHPRLLAIQTFAHSAGVAICHALRLQVCVSDCSAIEDGTSGASVVQDNKQHAIPTCMQRDQRAAVGIDKRACKGGRVRALCFMALKQAAQAKLCAALGELYVLSAGSRSVPMLGKYRTVCRRSAVGSVSRTIVF